jgi:hypothetical protein
VGHADWKDYAANAESLHVSSKSLSRSSLAPNLQVAHAVDKDSLAHAVDKDSVAHAVEKDSVAHGDEKDSVAHAVDKDSVANAHSKDYALNAASLHVSSKSCSRRSFALNSRVAHAAKDRAAKRCCVQRNFANIKARNPQRTSE